jgi:hypothetical protein
METEDKKYETLQEFWPYYVSEHKNPLNRNLHLLGSGIGLAGVAASVVKKKPKYALLGILAGYGLAWIGHFLVEKNKPATLKHPVKSLVSDWIMCSLMLRNKMEEEAKRIEILQEEEQSLYVD